MSLRQTLLVLAAALAACTPVPVATNDPGTAAADPNAATAATPTPAAEAPLPAAEEILAQAVEATGGADKLAALQSYYSEARFELPAQGLTADTRVWWKDGKFYSESDIPGLGLQRVWFDGTAVTSDDPVNGRRTLSGREASQIKWGTSVSLAADWKKFFETAKTAGKRKDGERELVDVELTGPDGNLTLAFDLATHLPAGQRYQQESPAGTLPVEISMKEFKDFGGIKQPTVNEMKMAVISATTRVTKFEPNAAIDDAKFVVPTASAEPEGPAAPKGKKPKAKAKAGAASK